MIVVRGERAGDAAAIAALVARAYADVPYSDHREGLMIERLREGEGYVPDLSLLAEIGGELVGHILLTRAWIESGEASVPTLALAPFSVPPGHRRSGIGARLVEAAHERASGLGFDSIVVVGIPGYYPRFGYRLLNAFPIDLPFDAPAANCLIRPLRAGALDGVSGRLRYADGWLDH